MTTPPSPSPSPSPSLLPPPPSSPSSSLNGDITSIQFALHPDVTLRVTLHRSIPINPHEVVNQLFQLPNNSNSEKFAILDAKRITSLDQIAVAANSALLRQHQFQQKNGSCGRGLALETILCCAGSTNTASVLRDYAFDKTSVAATQVGSRSSGDDDGDDGCGKYDILCLGFCSSDEEFEKVISMLKIGDAESTEQVHTFFARVRDEEKQELMKVYKITKEEVEMNGSSLEEAVNNRVAAKFYV